MWSGLCTAANGVCSVVCAPFSSFKRNARRNKFRRNDLFLVLFFLLLAFFIYWTYQTKYRYYRDAYSYIQGYTEALNKYINRK